MMRLAWITDPHLNFHRREGIVAFCEGVRASSPDVIVITGDIAEAHNLEQHLRLLDMYLACPVYFVLGNHDFYRGSIPVVRELAAALSNELKWLRWLPVTGVVELSSTAALVGHDGWADGRCGDYANSDVMLNDYLLIRELSCLNPQERLGKLNALGDEAAAYVRRVLSEAIARYERVFLAIHNPPFREACWYQGRVSSDNWLPHLACKAAGDGVLEILRAHPERDVTVLCGHTHGQGYVAMLPNLRVHTGGAEYGAPRVQRVFEVP